MEVSKQYPGVLFRSFLRTIGGRSTDAGISARFGHKVFGQITKSFAVHQGRDESIGGGDGLIDGWPCGSRGRHHGPEVPSPRVRSHRRRIVEQSEALGTGPSGRGHVSHPRTARRHESPSTLRSTVDRETKQLGLKIAKSESQPRGREGRRQRSLVEIARRQPFGKGNKKVNKTWESIEQIPGSSDWLDGRKTPTGVGAFSESGKRQALYEEPPVVRLRLPPRRGWFRDLLAKGPLPQHGKRESGTLTFFQAMR